MVLVIVGKALHDNDGISQKHHKVVTSVTSVEEAKGLFLEKD